MQSRNGGVDLQPRDEIFTYTDALNLNDKSALL